MVANRTGSFRYQETKPIFKLLEKLSSGSLTRSRCFDDFLHVVVCTLGRPLMESEYLETVKRYSEGQRGTRGIDLMAEMFALLVKGMEETEADIIGDLFEGAISYGEHGQFFTPEPVTTVMGSLVIPENEEGKEVKDVLDPACGSGRTLLAMAKRYPHWHYVGQDIDLRCVRMTAINLGLRNYYGHVIHGDTLAGTCSLIYETGRIGIWGNVIRKTNRVPTRPRETVKPVQLF